MRRKRRVDSWVGKRFGYVIVRREDEKGWWVDCLRCPTRNRLVKCRAHLRLKATHGYACGCTRRGKHRVRKDLTGRFFAKWQVIGIGKKYGPGRVVWFKVYCDPDRGGCGKTRTEVRRSDLTEHKTRGCRLCTKGGQNSRRLRAEYKKKSVQIVEGRIWVAQRELKPRTGMSVSGFLNLAQRTVHIWNNGKGLDRISLPDALGRRSMFFAADQIDKFNAWRSSLPLTPRRKGAKTVAELARQMKCDPGTVVYRANKAGVPIIKTVGRNKQGKVLSRRVLVANQVADVEHKREIIRKNGRTLGSRTTWKTKRALTVDANAMRRSGAAPKHVKALLDLGHMTLHEQRKGFARVENSIASVNNQVASGQRQLPRSLEGAMGDAIGASSGGSAVHTWQPMSPAALAGMLKCSDETVRDYAIKAHAFRPKRGQRNFRYVSGDILKIARHACDRAGEKEIREAARDMLRLSEKQK